MTILWQAGQESDDFSEWTSSNDESAQATQVAVEATPAGEDKVGAYAIHVTGHPTARKAPRVVLGSMISEWYLSFMMYYVGETTSGEDVTSLGSVAAETIMIFGNPPMADIIMDGGSINARLACSDAYTDTGNFNEGLLVVSGGDIPIGEWSQWDFHFQLVDNGATQDGLIEIKMNCGEIQSGTHDWGGVPDITTSMDKVYLCDSCSDNEYYIDNFVLNNTGGTFYSGFPCNEDPFNISVDAGGTIYPAPEKIPHVFNHKDFPGFPRNMADKLAKKLNDNFDSAERQLLALDPDSGNTENPFR